MILKSNFSIPNLKWGCQTSNMMHLGENRLFYIVPPSKTNSLLSNTRKRIDVWWYLSLFIRHEWTWQIFQHIQHIFERHLSIMVWIIYFEDNCNIEKLVTTSTGIKSNHTMPNPFTNYYCNFGTMNRVTS